MVGAKKAILQIWHESKMVGDITYDLDSQSFGLVYSAEWLRSGFALSPHLPLFDEIKSESTSKFLENLLPEEDALRTLARALQITSGNVFGLIAAIGKDATGAFSVLIRKFPYYGICTIFRQDRVDLKYQQPKLEFVPTCLLQ